MRVAPTSRVLLGLLLTGGLTSCVFPASEPPTPYVYRRQSDSFRAEDDEEADESYADEETDDDEKKEVDDAEKEASTPSPPARPSAPYGPNVLKTVTIYSATPGASTPAPRKRIPAAAKRALFPYSE